MKFEIDEYFQAMLNNTQIYPRHFQRETIGQILQGKNVLLRAPTGSGKTETAIAPFLFAGKMGITDFPSKLIYIVPLRTLATSLRSRTEKMVRQWEAKYPPGRPLVVTLQTGENPEDPRFEGDIIFCTIDQLLSSFLSIPYSVGRGSANVNAGVVFASYLVFDELHLLDPDRSFVTTLKLLQQVIGISPFLLMTATLTHELAAQISQEVISKGKISADLIQLVNVVDEDLKGIEGSRNRQFYPSDRSLSADSIIKDIQANRRQRVIVICNTVAQSQGLFRDLQVSAPSNINLTLLHSRFLPADRHDKEQRLQQIFAENWQENNDGKCYVLIATQVVEAGINITCQIMHSQLCPMNALLQRAGRCARFAGELGRVYVYRQIQVEEKNSSLANREEDDEAIATQEKREKQSFLPYKNATCELTWQVLQEHKTSSQADLPVGFEIEESWINRVHGEEDRLQAGKRSRNSSELETQFDEAVFHGKKSAAEHLIRFVDNRSVFMIEEPTIIDLEASDDIDVRQLQPFSLPRTTLLKIWREYLDSGDRTWMFKKVVPPEGKSGEGYALPKALPIKTQSELVESIRLVVNPQYASYDREIGLQIGVGVEGKYCSERKAQKSKISQEYSYHMDTYVGHLGRIWTCWQKSFKGELIINGQPTSVILSSSSDELKQAGGRFIRQKFFPKATLERTASLFELLVFLAVITHDLGKLQIKWQQVMQGWQAKAYELYCQLQTKPKFKITNPGSQLLAHTDHHPEDRLFKQAYDEYVKQNQRPPHAVEGAFMCFEILNAVLVPILEKQFQANEEQIELILHVVEMAAGRHHSAWAKGWEASNDKIRLHSRANEAIAQSWQRLVPRLSIPLPLPAELPKFSQTYEMEDFKLGDKIQDDDLQYQQLYWLVVRALRICDRRSVQLH
jgi:CRISPR-associated endonuclease/helicase Cas3